MSAISKRKMILTPSGGSHIHDVMKEAIQICLTEKLDVVEFTFNDIKYVFTPYDLYSFVETTKIVP